LNYLEHIIVITIMRTKMTSLRYLLKPLVLLSFLILFTFISRAQNQFYGAEIFYTYIENNTYEFTLKYYVRCGSENFDKPDKLEVRCVKNDDVTNVVSKLKHKSVRSHTQFCDPLVESCKHQEIYEIETYEFVFQIDFDERELQKYQNCGRVRVAADVSGRDSFLVGYGANDVLSVFAEMDLLSAPRNSSPIFLVEPEFYISCKSGAMMSLNATDQKEDDSISYHISYGNMDTQEGVFFMKIMAIFI